MKLEGIRLDKSDSNASKSTSRKDRVIINVGGNRHETYLSTLRVVPDSRLAWIGENTSKQAEYDPETNELFFDRHPGVFANILNYYRTGKLHCPGDVCGPLFEEELAFWGIEELQMEPCCWSNYTQHREAQATLKAFEGLQKGNGDSDNDNSAMGLDYQSTKMEKTTKEQIWALLEQPYSSKYAQILAMVSLAVIVLSVSTFCVESMLFFKQYKSVFRGLEYLYCVWFTLEFVARFFACPDKIAYFKSFMTWVDLLSVIPLYISLTNQVEELDFLFVLRLVRIFRLFRFFRTMSGMQVIGHTLRASARELFLLILILSIPMVIFSTLLYYAEKWKFGEHTDFVNIPETFWWAVITMTTVGYGDVYPKSAFGKMIGTVCACVGVLIVALPVSVIGSNFTLFYSHAQAQLKLPKKKKKPLLLGAAGVLVSDTSLQDMDGDDDDDGGGGGGGNDGSDGGEGKPEPRYSVSEFRHLRNPSIHPRSRSMRRKAQADIDMPAVLSSKFQKTESDNSDVELPSATKTPLLSLGHSDTSNMSNISNGLKGISDVMLQITAPVTRRMALSPIATPPARRSNRRKKRSKRASGTGNEESSGYERESFYTTDADSAAENNHARLEELREQMRIQKNNQSLSSNSSNYYYPHSSKENITSSEENARSPISHEGAVKETDLTKVPDEDTAVSDKCLPCYENKPPDGSKEIDPIKNHGDGKPMNKDEAETGTQEGEDIKGNNSPGVSDPSSVREEDKSDVSSNQSPQRARTPEKPPPNIWDRPPDLDLDTWVKQPKVRTRSYLLRKSPDLSKDKNDRLRNDTLHHRRENVSVTFDDTPKRTRCNGSTNDLRVPCAHERKNVGDRNSGTTHPGILKDRTHSRSLDRLRKSPDSYRKHNEDVILIESNIAPDIERTHSRSNTIV